MHNQIWFQEYHKIATLCNHHDTIVYLAQHVKLLDKFVIKKVKKDSIAYQQARMEAKLLQTLQHPCIPVLYHVYEDHDSIYLIEQYMEGESLQSICQSEQLSISTILSYSIQLCDIVFYLHSQLNPILHLDINPNNIIVTQDRVALIDFSAAMCKKNSFGNVGRYGTIGFAAPEQFSNKVMDERTDIYGLGTTMNYMFQQIGSFERKLWQKEYHKLGQIIHKCMGRRKMQRYSRVQQVGSLLSQIYKRRVGGNKEKELLIAVAGTQSHIGVTHTSLLLCSYLKNKKQSCLYVELNDSGVAKSLIQQKMALNQEAIYEYEQIPILPSFDLEQLYKYQEHYKVVVADYGTLSKENTSDFMKSDLRILVYGGKVYEWPLAEKCIRGITSFRDTYFLENFQTAREFKEIHGIIPREQCFSLPYVPDMKRLDLSSLEDTFTQLLQAYL